MPKWFNIWRSLLNVAGLFCLSSCALHRPPIDYEAYEKMHFAPGAKVLRNATKALPGINQHVYYGNYGGPGNNGGSPADTMDELFRRHDIAYYLCESPETLYRADELLVEGLKSLKPEDLSMTRSEKFRQRAIKYFEGPLAQSGLGKPGAIMRREETEINCPLEVQGVLEALFDLNLPGMPPLSFPRSAEESGSQSASPHHHHH